MQAREAQLSNTFVTLAGTLVQGFELTDLMFTLASACVDLLDVDAAGIMLADPSGKLQIISSSDERMRLLELFELQNHEGPCMDTYESGRPVGDPDLNATERWPLFTARAVEEGFSSVDALPLRLRGDVIGALNLFRREPGGLNEDDRGLAQALADVAVIGLLQERLVREAQLLAEQLQRALNNRVVIEQAKGILAEQGGVNVDEAFEHLRTYARNHNLSVAHLAHAVVTGTRTYRTLT